MKYRFIEYEDEIYIVVGIAYDTFDDMCFIAVLLDKSTKSLAKCALSIHTKTIPLLKAKEITDRNRLISLMVLYG